MTPACPCLEPGKALKNHVPFTSCRGPVVKGAYRETSPLPPATCEQTRFTLFAVYRFVSEEVLQAVRTPCGFLTEIASLLRSCISGSVSLAEARVIGRVKLCSAFLGAPASGPRDALKGPLGH